jgi:hypothetical protein
MSAITFPSSSLGLPKEIKYELPPQLEENSRSYSAHISPNGITQITGASVASGTATTFVANSAGLVGQAFSSQNIAFDLPCGQGPGVFLDPTATTLNFRLNFNLTTGTTIGAGAGIKFNLIGSAASFFDSLILVSNNTPIEQINNYGQFFNMSLNSLVSQSNRFGSINQMGCDTNTNNGVDLPIPSTAGNYFFNFCIPLMSIIGQNTQDKWLPIGLINALQLQLNTAALLPISTFCTTVPTTSPGFTPILDQFSLNLKYIDIGTMSGNMMLQSLGGSKIYIKSSTYTNSNVAVPNGSSGALQQLLQIRNSSVKSLFFYQAIQTSARCPNGTYDAVNNGSAIKVQGVVGGNRYPTRELNPSQRPSECMNELQKAWGRSGNFIDFGGVLNRESYGATIPSRVAQFDSGLVVPAAGVRPAADGSDEAAANRNIVSFPNMHYLGLDLEKSTSVLFSGVNTRSTPPVIEYILGVQTDATASLYAWALSDLVLEIDPLSKSVVGYI